ncbi:hypothetical protein H5410_046833 [Solanum commersonii]|uniref:Retrotransposon gag domain-containing protein n=1 Tax=Solanum commersonii TaxID=4109 RepID=A0A9J5XFI3_SOLCO|nr:hypothetical protein H5410_046833 [Solanum commersonii]
MEEEEKLKFLVDSIDGVKESFSREISEMQYMLKEVFQKRDLEVPEGRLAKLRQTTTVAEYQSRLEEVSNETMHFPDQVSKICAAKDHSTQLVGIADALGYPRYGVASRNCSVIRRLLPFIANLIFSFKAQHTGTLGEQFIKDVPNSATEDSTVNAHKTSQFTHARINCALKVSSCDSPLSKNLKLTTLASNAS